MREATLEIISEGGGNIQPLEGIHPRAVDNFEAAVEYAFSRFGGYHFDQLPEGVFSGKVADAKQVFPSGGQILLIAGEVPMYRDALVLGVPQDLEWPKRSPTVGNIARLEKVQVDIVRPERSAFGLRRSEYDLMVGFRLNSEGRILPRHFQEVVIDRKNTYEKIDETFELPAIGELDLEQALAGEDEASYNELYLMIKDSEVYAVGVNNAKGVNPRLTPAHQQPLLGEMHLLLAHVLQYSPHNVDTNGTSR